MGDARNLLALTLAALTACTSGEFDTGSSEPDPLKPSDLSVLGLKGTLATIYVSHVPTLYFRDDFSNRVVGPRSMTLLDRIAAGERRTPYEGCVAWIPILGCILIESGETSAYDVVELSLTALDGTVNIETSFSDGTRQDPPGGETDGFTVYVPNVGPVNLLLFNTQGSGVNGYSHATIALWNPAWGENASGHTYAWSSIIGRAPARVHDPEGVMFYNWEKVNAGTARYLGPMEAYFFQGSEVLSRASGTADLVMDFDARELSGRITGINAGDLALHDLALGPGVFDPASSYPMLSGALATDGGGAAGAPEMAGSYAAMVFGDGAEIGGSFGVEGGDAALLGGFLGKRP